MMGVYIFIEISQIGRQSEKEKKDLYKENSKNTAFRFLRHIYVVFMSNAKCMLDNGGLGGLPKSNGNY